MISFLLLLVLAAGPDEVRFTERSTAARTALEEGRLEQAEQLYRELITLYPQRVSPYQGLADVFTARGEDAQAVDLLLEVGRKLVQVSRESDALAPLDQALRLAPDHAEAHALRGRVLGEQRRYREAVIELERAVELGSTRLETFLYLAASHWESQDFSRAEAVYRRALEIHGDATVVLYHFGQFLLWLGRAGDAVEPLEKAADQLGGNTEALVYLARALAESGEPERAADTYRKVLALDPENKSARYGLDLLRRRPGATKTEDTEADDAGVVLTPVARQAGLDFRHDPGTTPHRHLPETMGSGLAWLDYDGDGWWDLYLVQSGPFPPDGGPAAANRLYRNRGPGEDGRVTFEDVTERSGAGERSFGQGAVAADVDGDGDTDLFLTNYGPDVLLLNRGDGTFEDASEPAGLALDGWSSSAAFADADADGDLDLFVTGYVDYDPASARACRDASGRAEYCDVVFFTGADDAFFVQRGDGTFEEATLASGFEHPAGRGLGVVFTDLDGDDRPDVYVANDADPNRLYLNRGPGADGRPTFEDVSLLSGAAFDREGKTEAGMGVAAGDVDGDALAEIAVTHYDTETNTLYRNLGDGRFTDVSAASGFGLASYNLLGFGIVLADFDLDGDLDAYVANGHVLERPTRDTVTRAQRDLLLLGTGAGRFVDQGFQGGADRVGRGAAAADYDGDGDPDVAVQHSGASPELWRNETIQASDGQRRAGSACRPARPGRRSLPYKSWLGIELQGRPRNSQAVGARVTLRGGGRSQVRWVVVGESYQSSGDRRGLFARDEAPAEVEVRWPTGRRQLLRNLPASCYLRLTHP